MTGDELDVWTRKLIALEDRIRELELAAATAAHHTVAHVLNPAPAGWTSTSTTQIPLPGITVSPTLRAGRRYLLSFHGRFVSTVAGDVVTARFLLDGVDGQVATVAIRQTVIGETVVHWATYEPSATAVVAVSVAGSRAAGTGTVSLVATATTPTELLIEDIGPA